MLIKIIGITHYTFTLFVIVMYCPKVFIRLLNFFTKKNSLVLGLSHIRIER